MPNITHKQCIRCKVWKPWYYFHLWAESEDGLYMYCKACRKEVNDGFQARKQAARDTNAPLLDDSGVSLQWEMGDGYLFAYTQAPYIQGVFKIEQIESGWRLSTGLNRPGGIVSKSVMDSPDLEWLLSMCRAHEAELRIEEVSERQKRVGRKRNDAI